MKEIVKVLLQEGIDEETIHEVLAVIDEKVSQVNRYAAAIKSVSPRYKKLEDIQKRGGSPEEEQSAMRRLHQAKNIVDTKGEGGAVATTSVEKINPEGHKVIARTVKSYPMTRKQAVQHDDYMAGNTGSYSEYEKAIKKK